VQAAATGESPPNPRNNSYGAGIGEFAAILQQSFRCVIALDSRPMNYETQDLFYGLRFFFLYQPFENEDIREKPVV
jgi:hypothetical protein